MFISIKSSSAVTVSDFYPAQENDSLVYYNDESCEGDNSLRSGLLPKNILNLQTIPSFSVVAFSVSSLRCSTIIIFYYYNYFIIIIIKLHDTMQIIISSLLQIKNIFMIV